MSADSPRFIRQLRRTVRRGCGARQEVIRPLRNSLGEAMTPLWPTRRLGEQPGLDDLWIKDEGLNPTGTFKARGAATGVSRAKELGIPCRSQGRFWWGVSVKEGTVFGQDQGSRHSR